ncbi:MAG TPA: hypothetical protein VGB46_12260 [Flavisolibacter sp.]|jgi:hypothetical protein
MKVQKKYILVVCTVLLLSVVTLAITGIAGTGEQTPGTAQSAGEAPDGETATGDDPWKEVKQIVNNYYNPGGIAYKGKMKLIDDNGEAEKVIEEMDFEYTLLGEEYHFRMGTMEVVRKDDRMLAVDHASKTVAVSRQQGGQAPAQLFDMEQFKKILEEKKASAKVSLLNGQKIVTIDEIQDPSIQGYRIYYDPATYRIARIEIGMLRYSPLEEPEETGEKETGDQKPSETEDEIPTYTYYLEVNYTEVKILELKKKEFRPESKFIQAGSTEPELTPTYRDYNLISAGE